jgi:phospholipid/cholesterol/gamma-HCH transport system ATP-binding protein
VAILIEILNVSKKFDKTDVLKNVNAKFEKNDISLVLGQSGEGKSVLMKSIVGLEHIDTGKILIDKNDVSDLSENEFIKFRKKCSYNFQLPALIKAKTVFQNVALPLLWEGKKVIGFEERVLAALEKVDLVNVKNHYPSELSYSMQKKVSFARALVMDPDYIILDEPTTGLDPISSMNLYDNVKRFVEEFGKGVVIVTHDIEGVAYLTGKIYLLKDGKFVFEGRKKDFFSSDSIYVKNFLGPGYD